MEGADFADRSAKHMVWDEDYFESHSVPNPTVINDCGRPEVNPLLLYTDYQHINDCGRPEVGLSLLYTDYQHINDCSTRVSFPTNSDWGGAMITTGMSLEPQLFRLLRF